PPVDYAFGVVPQGGPLAGTQGFFGSPFSWPINGIHEILLPDGRVMNYGTSPTGAQGAALIYDVWSPTLGTGPAAHNVLPNTTATDIFCGAQSLMWSTGEVLITGGALTVSGTRNYSNNQMTIFSPQSNTIRNGGTMAYPRWYPSITAMPNN